MLYSDRERDGTTVRRKHTIEMLSKRRTRDPMIKKTQEFSIQREYADPSGKPKVIIMEKAYKGVTFFKRSNTGEVEFDFTGEVKDSIITRKINILRNRRKVRLNHSCGKMLLRSSCPY